MSAAPDAVEIRVPSESFEGTRARLLRWLKTPGAIVAAGEPLIEVETDKVTVEIAAPAAGTLGEPLKAVDDELNVGDLLGHISAAGGAAAAGAAPARSAAIAPRASTETASAAGQDATSSLSPAVRRLLAQHRLRETDLAGSGTGGRITVDDILRHVADQGAHAPSEPGKQ